MSRTKTKRTQTPVLELTALTVLLAVGASGCGTDVVLGDGRSQPDDDASTATPRFSEPVVIEALAGDAYEDDDDPSLNHELTWIFFNSTRYGGLGGADVWFSQRASPAEPWRAPQPATTLNSKAHETGTALSADGLTIYWSSGRDGGAGGLDIYGATRATLQDPWSDPQAMDELNSSGDDLVSALCDNERRVLFARRDDSSDDYDLWWARRNDSGEPWSAPKPIDELNSDHGEADPFLVDDGGRTLLFTREGNLQLAHRPGEDTPFGEAQPLSTLNSDGEEHDAWSDQDLSYVVFASNRGGEFRLYEASREPAP